MTKARRLLAATLLVDLRAALEGCHDPVALGVGWDGAIYAAARLPEESLAAQGSVAVSPKTGRPVSGDHKVVRWSEGQMQTLVRHGEAIVVSFVQPVLGGVLLADATRSRPPHGSQMNAVVVDWGGRELRRFTLADGIADVRVTRDGTIWVSYFDEGVCGNQEQGIGTSGLVAFSPLGEMCFSYKAELAQTEAICDVYAMNVAGEKDVWLYFYVQFPIVRIVNGAYHVWKLGVGGAHALAVAEDRVLLFGDYKDRSLGRIVELGRDGVARVVEEVTVVDDRGEPLGDVVARGVGGDLFLFTDRRALIVHDW